MIEQHQWCPQCGHSMYWHSRVHHIGQVWIACEDQNRHGAYSECGCEYMTARGEDL